MNTNTLRTSCMTLSLIGLLLAVAGCSTSTDNGPDCRYNQAWLNGECWIDPLPLVLPTGIWNGTDTVGRQVLMLVSASGTFQFVDGVHNQGSGYLAPESEVQSLFDLVTPIDQPFADGTTLASCTITGSLVERVSIDLTQTCTTSAGLKFSETLALDFDPLYDRDSSLEAISGTYQTPAGNVLSIAADGLLFVQDAASGCVTNGRVSLIATGSNLYNVTLQQDSCEGPDAAFNGSMFDGLALLDDTESPEVLTIAVIGDVGGIAVASFERLFRL